MNTPSPLQFIVVTLLVLLVLVAATMRVLWWFWTMHEQDAQRERLRQRANGRGAVDHSWAQYQEARKERER